MGKHKEEIKARPKWRAQRTAHATRAEREGDALNVQDALSERSPLSAGAKQDRAR